MFRTAPMNVSPFTRMMAAVTAEFPSAIWKRAMMGKTEATDETTPIKSNVSPDPFERRK
jgi:hypothetical protein